MSMALAHEKLYQSESLVDLDLREYIDGLVDHLVGSAYVNTQIQLKKEIDDVSFGIDTAIPVGFILTELVSNCLKHAFPQGGVGEIAISLRSINPQEFELVVSDNGVGTCGEIGPREPVSLGTKLVKAFVDKLKGSLEILSRNGTLVRIKFKEI